MSSPSVERDDAPHAEALHNDAENQAAKEATPKGKVSKQHTRGKHSGRCTHLSGKTKAVIDRLKVLVPYANVCRHRQALLLGRRGATGGDREGTPAAGEGDRSRKRLVDEMPSPTCITCHTAGDRLHACLTCDHYACWRRTHDTSHITQHLRQSGHPLALDFARLVVYCAQCGDYVHDATVDTWLLGAQMRWHAALCDAAEPEAKRPRIVAPSGDLSPAQAKYVRDHGALQACGGVRGLRNLGATCYLSAVLQALAHNPLVRGWMLSDGHHPRTCSMEPCMACELDTAFQALFAGGAVPFAPTRLLRALWLLRGDLAGYGQQDAHECLMALLDTLHVGLAGANAERPCTCAVHRTFAGLLQSTVTCSRCGNTTHALDPMLDVSLDIPSRKRPVSLHDCLEHFTRAEALAGYACARCGSPARAVKQLSIKQLPPVLALQLKRFRHGAKRGAKEDAYVRLPEHIDMTPYTAAALGRTEDARRRPDARRANPACQYVLFAVVEHVGRLDTGHYTAYARQRAQWYRFDDANVAPADIRDVLALAEEAKARAGRPSVGRAYMAFYHKHVLDYHDGAHVGDVVEDSGSVRPEAKAERRGRKKGVGKRAATAELPRAGTEGAEDGEIDEFLAAGSLAQVSESSDSDGEALWDRINRQRAPDLVPMRPPLAASQMLPGVPAPAPSLDASHNDADASDSS
ncbi:hypothetical protein IW150_005579 [Coemansia sp. RSA 2607]|nr:hypothetical protein IW150_005579 [Coemansia sp. RSA 2607]